MWSDQQAEVQLYVKKGIGLYEVAYLLEEKGLIHNVTGFRWAAWIKGVEHSIQPGYFLIPQGLNHSQLLDRLARSGLLTKDITVPEGLTVKQIAGIIRRELDVDSAEFVRWCEDSLFAMELGVSGGRLEGYLYPETYNLYIDSDPQTVIARMVEQFFVVFNDSLRHRLKEVKLTLPQAVTLASLIQGEIMLDEEAPLVSAVYYNRLRKGMLLQSCPTVQYILPDGPRRLLTADLEIDHPYNTYIYKGLPPGPINNPGRAALRAALYPADDKEIIYLVAQGDGYHRFNRTLSGHEQDKGNLRRARRELVRQRKENNDPGLK